MEELQDAIEDAQYVNAIATQVEGPRPVLSWDIPSEEQLTEWEETRMEDALMDPDAPEVFGIDWCLHSEIGFFLFAGFLKDTYKDFFRINFIEDVIQWRKMRGQQRIDRAKRIFQKYLSKVQVNSSNGKSIYPDKREIIGYELRREIPNIDDDELETLLSENKVGSHDPASLPTSNCLRISGPILREIQIDISRRENIHNTKGAGSHKEEDSAELMELTQGLPDRKSIREKYSSLKQLTDSMKVGDSSIFNGLFKKVDVLVIESLRKDYWLEFTESKQFTRMKNFMWFYDRKVVEDDFFSMRVLGRGGFGVVTACKKGTSGKLYAMKVMNKRRIKTKKSELLAINEQRALAAVESPFVVNLKYSFHSKDNIYLILDLMTGGDLSYHLQQKGSIPLKECKYYAARIMLGLQALHDKGYVYRDLKPENLLLAEDGRVKITDLGLATKINPKPSGAAGTRGYWAPEMLRRNSHGKRMPYGHTVDWFSFGCCLAEFISGHNPFRSQAALTFGQNIGNEDSKEKAIDYATMEMTPDFSEESFEPEAADLVLRLLEKDENVRLGSQGCEQIMAHPWFNGYHWEATLSDRKSPPWIPPKDVNAASQSEIGNFEEDKKFQECLIDDRDERYYDDWDWTNPNAYASEVVEFLVYERETGKPILPLDDSTNCCCSVM